GKSRNSLLPTRLIPAIKQLIEQARLIQQDDNLQGVGPSLPFALDRKYPSAYRQAAWMFVFPSSTLCNHPYNGKLCRHHLHDSVTRWELTESEHKCGMCSKRFSCHAVSCSFARHICQGESDIRTSQERLGHTDVKTAEIYTHVLGQNFAGTTSAADGFIILI